MSNQIPELNIDDPETIPYCIWYPDVAVEETYRQLAERYPVMRYHEGRACAVAGYTGLYRDLKLLPDVSIAEEARDNRSNDIFEDIMLQPVRYAIINDYRRTVNVEHAALPASLNGDTAVRSQLDRRVSLEDLVWKTRLISDGDIAEDGYINESTTNLFDVRIPPTAPDHTLLYSPLPPDLPALRFSKDLLILMAACDGNIDRYARLKRPVFMDGEIMCVVRGIYHNTS
jgi:hypothetical protein